MPSLVTILKFLVIIVPLLLLVALLTLLERKIMAAIQIRRGPNVIGFGVLQPLADGVKLLIKELIIPLRGNKWLFLLSPVLFLSLSLSTWSIIPFEEHYVASPNLTVLVFLAFSSLSVYGILLGGWASNSRYAFLGALRSASQMISYELVLSLLVLLVCILAQSFNFIDIVNSQYIIWFIVPLAPFALVYMIAILAETNRTPFDLPEAEAELVAGYSVEYSSGPFAFYFIAEYCNLIIWSFTTIIFFFGGWLPGFIISFLATFILFSMKSMSILALFCCIRAALPRYRWDQLMILAWRAFLPIVLLGCFFVYSFFNFSSTFVGLQASFIFFTFAPGTNYVKNMYYNFNLYLIRSPLARIIFISFCYLIWSSYFKVVYCATTDDQIDFENLPDEVLMLTLQETFKHLSIAEANETYLNMLQIAAESGALQETPEESVGVEDPTISRWTRLFLFIGLSVAGILIFRYGPFLFDAVPYDEVLDAFLYVTSDRLASMACELCHNPLTRKAMITYLQDNFTNPVSAELPVPPTSSV